MEVNVVDALTQAPTESTVRSRENTQERFAVGVFAALAIVSSIGLVAVGRAQWFSSDEWDFLANRSAFDIGDLFRPHNEHLSALPILVFRSLWWVAGGHTYVPYLTVLVSLHVFATVLLRIVMRRAGAGPWISTIAAGAFLWFGPGAFNIEFAFQIGFVGALVFGLLHLLAADRDGPMNGRDWLGVAAGAAAIFCSAVGVAMAIVVGVSTLMRRGWRIAMLHTAPLVAIFALWYAFAGRFGPRHRLVTAHEAMKFVRANVTATFDSIGRHTGVGVAIAVVLVSGLVVAWTSMSRAEVRARLNTVCALIAGAIAILAMATLGRAELPRGIGIFVPGRAEPQVVYLLVALVLPPLAVAATMLESRWRPFGLIAVVLLLLGVPANVRQLKDTADANAQFQRVIRRELLSAPHLPVASELPRSLRPEPVFAPEVTLGWLRDEVAAGRLPTPANLTPGYEATLTLRLALQRTSGWVLTNDCDALTQASMVDLPEGGTLGVRGGGIDVTSTTPSGTRSDPIFYSTLTGGDFVLAAAVPITVEVTPRARSGNEVLLCSAERAS